MGLALASSAVGQSAEDRGSRAGCPADRPSTGNPGPSCSRPAPARRRRAARSGHSMRPASSSRAHRRRTNRSAGRASVLAEMAISRGGAKNEGRKVGRRPQTLHGFFLLCEDGPPEQKGSRACPRPGCCRRRRPRASTAHTPSGIQTQPFAPVHSSWHLLASRWRKNNGTWINTDFLLFLAPKNPCLSVSICVLFRLSSYEAAVPSPNNRPTTKRKPNPTSAPASELKNKSRKTAQAGRPQKRFHTRTA